MAYSEADYNRGYELGRNGTDLDVTRALSNRSYRDGWVMGHKHFLGDVENG